MEEGKKDRVDGVLSRQELTRTSKRTEKQIADIQATCDKKRLDVRLTSP